MSEVLTKSPGVAALPARPNPEKRGLRAFLSPLARDVGVSIAVLVLSLGTVYAAVALQRGATAYNTIVTLNTQLQMQAFRQSALEDQAIAAGAVSSRVSGERQDAVRIMQTHLAAIDQLINKKIPLSNLFELEHNFDKQNDGVAQAFENYQEAVDKEFSFLERGEIARAKAIDEAEVDPAFERLSSMIEAANAAFSRNAERMASQAIVGEWLTIVFVLVSMLWLLRRLEHSRREVLLTKATEIGLYETKMLVEHASDIVARLDRDGVTTFLSPAVEAILGGGPDELLGQSIWSHVEPADLGHARRFQGQLLEQPGIRQQCELNFLHNNGSRRVLELRGTNLLSDPKVGAIIPNARDISERKGLEGRLERQALHDALTGLPNRRLLLDRLGHALSRSYRQRVPVAVMFLDLDRFKLINDTLGHEMGDQLLIMVAQRLKTCIRAEDTVARLGGDEFTILIEEVTDAYNPVEVAKRIVAVLDEPFKLADHELTVAASIGIAQSVGEENSSADMLRDADIAMYRAKKNGVGRYECYDASMAMEAPEKLKLEGDLRRAIKHSTSESSEFVLHYQPLIDLRTGATVAFEALVRWQHPERGLLAPAHFIALAEETGLIIALGEWVLETACRQALVFHAQLGSTPGIAVNLSLKQLKHPSLVEDVEHILQVTGLSPNLLELEITESHIMEDVVGTVSKLGELKALGVRLAIDDFGTGYSSLGHLMRFPIDNLKIDRSFVQRLPGNRDSKSKSDASIVEAVVALSRALNLGVVTEGIETEQQLAYLKDLDCDVGQGYLFAKPMPADAVVLFVLQHLTTTS